RGQKGAVQPQSQRGQGCKARRQAEDRGRLDRARSRLQPEQVPRTRQSLPSERRRKGGIHNRNQGTANLSRRRYRRRSRNEGTQTRRRPPPGERNICDERGRGGSSGKDGGA